MQVGQEFRALPNPPAQASLARGSYREQASVFCDPVETFPSGDLLFALGMLLGLFIGWFTAALDSNP